MDRAAERLGAALDVNEHGTIVDKASATPQTANAMRAITPASSSATSKSNVAVCMKMRMVMRNQRKRLDAFISSARK